MPYKAVLSDRGEYEEQIKIESFRRALEVEKRNNRVWKAILRKEFMCF
jgi:hypothetical protein